ncbi:MAG: agglutinin biogenesis protein MshP [Pseudomonadota bacterium]
MRGAARPVFPRRRCARGVSLVTAIFILVVLAGLGVAMMSIATSQQASSALDVQGARAYQAARAGIEWGLYSQRVDAVKPCASATPSSFQLPANSSLSVFRVTVTCVLNSVTVGTLSRYRMTAVACNQASGACPNASANPDYVQRRVQIEFGDLN